MQDKVVPSSVLMSKLMVFVCFVLVCDSFWSVQRPSVMFVLTPARDGFEYYSPDTKDKKLSHVSTGHLPAIADVIILFSTSGGITLLI